MLTGLMRAACTMLCVLVFAGPSAQAQVKQTKQQHEDKFRQLDESWPTPNDQRIASGMPGPKYWQQQADYKIKVELNDDNQTITGSEIITYKNNSPHILRYIWVRLDQNRFAKHSDDHLTQPAKSTTRMSFAALRHEKYRQEFEGGFDISAVTDARGKPLEYSIVRTMMRIDLPKPLKAGASVKFGIVWSYKIIESKQVPIKRSGFDHFKTDGNNINNLGQWYPRVAGYTDVKAWNNRTFYGLGEFQTEFGTFDVEITVPSDHIVAGTGELQNSKDVLTKDQRDRLVKARASDRPVFIVTREEALAAQVDQAKTKKTWKFKAKKVRDFAFATSRKFVWDAMGYKQEEDGRTIMAMSFYPEEGMPLWDKYSTEAIVHTLEVYSKYTFPYPYPVAQSINSATSGMEYPMVSFNPRRPKEDDDGNRTYSRATKYGLIGVIIHEVGHNYFPMIINTPERDWFWMDEGFNTFMQSLAHREWEEGWPGNLGAPEAIIPFMMSKNQVPVMTDPESLLQFGANAYLKPAVAFNILRETVMGREAFDHAFKEYARRWKFKRPYPADFFRTMEDASGYDLDWFWRGWFYTTDHVDIALERVTWGTVNTKDPDVEMAYKKANDAEAGDPKIVEAHKSDRRRALDRPELQDFYNKNDKYSVADKDREKYKKYVDGLADWERELLKTAENFYFLEFTNKGGLVMPVIVEIEYVDGEKEMRRWPAELWRRNPNSVIKLVTSAKEIKSVTLDPKRETADVDTENNYWPRRAVRTRVELFKRKKKESLMKKMGEKAAYN
ncbi:MAG: M1 family metallopeptidase [Kordiimonadaceae bacterium]|nr:M1 family metallopeptidase [Kordiimonadaceae bacterium]